jgi:hypothetical protein
MHATLKQERRAKRREKKETSAVPSKHIEEDGQFRNT